jgi:hypothetical protein
MNPRLIVIDGKTYRSLNEMPTDVRARYEQAMRSLKDQDGNRVPDVLEGNNLPADAGRDGIPDLIGNTAGTPLVTNSLKVLVDGQEYNSLEDLPPEARARYEQAMSALDANRNSIPDFVEGMLGAHGGMSHVANQQTNHTLHHAPRPPMPVSPVITPDTSNGWMFALLGAFLLFLCAAGALGVWYFLFR